jgi:hypothetical protein
MVQVVVLVVAVVHQTETHLLVVLEHLVKVLQVATEAVQVELTQTLQAVVVAVVVLLVLMRVVELVVQVVLEQRHL